MFDFRKTKRAILCASMLSLLSISLNGCHTKDDDFSNEVLEEKLTDLENSIELLKKENRLSEITKTLNEALHCLKKSQEKFIAVPSVMAKENVNIRTSDVDGELMGTLVKGSTLEIAESMPHGWYKVFYYDKIGYIKGDYVKEIDTYKINGSIQKVCYVEEDRETMITIPKEVSMTGKEEYEVLPEFECLEIYEEYEDKYLAKTNDYIGYVPKTNLGELKETFVDIDISSQELKLYENNEIILKTPVVTGNLSEKNCDSDKGLFEIYKFKENDYLRGPGYASYVEYAAFYNKGEAIHDASWRSIYGGNIYETNGSHGCINTPRDNALKLKKHVSIGTEVIVHG